MQLSSEQAGKLPAGELTDEDGEGEGKLTLLCSCPQMCWLAQRSASCLRTSAPGSVTPSDGLHVPQTISVQIQPTASTPRKPCSFQCSPGRGAMGSALLAPALLLLERRGQGLGELGLREVAQGRMNPEGEQAFCAELVSCAARGPALLR